MALRKFRFQPAERHEIENAVAAGGVTLVLGAGVSQSRNLPAWGQLTSRIWKTTFGTKYPLLGADHPFAHQFALELIEQELHETNDGSIEGNPFINAVREALYEGADDQIRGKPGDTLGVVAKILRHEAKQPERRIRSVITFNVDSLLEEEVHRYLKWKTPFVWPVSRASDDPLRASDAIPIYHLHGYIPRVSAALAFKVEGNEKFVVRAQARRKGPMRKTTFHQLVDEAADTFVFTDWQYWRLSTTPVSFANRIVSDALHKSRCIFVGLSMTDVNLIRWLGARAVELELDVQSEFGMIDAQTGGRRHRQQHFWIRPRSADTTGVIGGLLGLRGVRSIEIDSWSTRDFERLMSRSFKVRLGR